MTGIRAPFGVVMVEPEIPQNTGNVARLCAATGAHLHLVRPLGFFLDDKHMKRAGLDYWDMVNLTVHDDFQHLVDSQSKSRLIMATTKGSQAHSSYQYQQGDLLIFGPESRGLSNTILSWPGGSRIRVPMLPDTRSLNLANSVAIVLYEALRQIGYPGLTPS